ncbi:hypothetical protein ACFQ2M_19390 [Kitasatospora saccharophila]|uniref:hypothetical protein n=1 Tax=Kitasatospora saccharophila TaxID=407973 RepID=UPI0031D6B17E
MVCISVVDPISVHRAIRETSDDPAEFEHLTVRTSSGRIDVWVFLTASSTTTAMASALAVVTRGLRSHWQLADWIFEIQAHTVVGPEMGR